MSLLTIVFVSLLYAFGFDAVNPGHSEGGRGVHHGWDAPRAVERAFPSAFTPSSLRRRLLGPYARAGGAGVTVAILSAGDYAFEPFLARFDRAFHLPPARVSTYPRPARALVPSEELSLDVELVHAMTPKARIVVVHWKWDEGAKTLARLLKAARPAVVAVTMTPTRALIVARRWAMAYAPLARYSTFAASGDRGPGLSMPALLPWVTAVGGVEYPGSKTAAWPLSGTGIADYAALRPPWQRVSSLWRETPDVAWLAGAPGVVAYGPAGWAPVGGTSVATPLWASLWAVADQLRLEAHRPPLTGQAAPTLYAVARRAPGAFCQPSASGACTPYSVWRPGIGLGVPVPSTLLPWLVRWHGGPFNRATPVWPPWLYPFAILAAPVATVVLLLLRWHARQYRSLLFFTIPQLAGIGLAVFIARSLTTACLGVIVTVVLTEVALIAYQPKSGDIGRH